MALRQDPVDRRMNDFRDSFQRAGLKITHQRLEILREVVSSDTHPDADTIYRRVRKRVPTIALDTVYRNLKSLTDEGFISVAGMGYGRVRFDGNTEHHHHFVCLKCGSIRDFRSASLGAIEPPQEAKALGNPVSLHLEVKGVCKRCAGRKKGRR